MVEKVPFTVPSVCSIPRRVARPDAGLTRKPLLALSLVAQRRRMPAIFSGPFRTFSVSAFAAALRGHRHCRLRTRRLRILALTVFWIRFHPARLAGRLGPLVA